MNLTWVGIGLNKIRPELLFILFGVTLILVCLGLVLSLSGVGLKDIAIGASIIGVVAGGITTIIAVIHWMEN